MADEPNKDIEKILRAYTEARRKGADLPLHPATRKMLHAEVARRYQNRGAAGPLYWSRLRAFWPQLAFGSGLCAILIIAVLSLRQPPRVPSPASVKEERLSETPPTRDRYLRESVEKQDKHEVSTPSLGLEGGLGRGAAANAPAPPTAPELDALAPKQKAQTIKPEILRRSDVRSLSSDEKEVTEREEKQIVRLKDASEERLLKQRVDDKPESRANSAPTPVSRAYKATASASPRGETTLNAAGRLAAVSEITNLGAALRTKFVEVPNTANLATASGVLNSFQFEQQGDDLRIVDRDGSIYYGQLSPGGPAQQPTQPNALSFGAMPAAPVSLPALAENTSNTTVYFLRAQGTNVTLAKPVTLEGRFLERTNVATFGEAQVQAASVASKRATLSVPNNPRKTIVGRVTVGQTNEFPVNAVSVEPGN